MRIGCWATDGRTQAQNVTTNSLVLMKRLILAPNASWRSGLLSGSTCITIQLQVKEMTCACAWRCYLLEWCDVMQSGKTVPTFRRICCPHLPWRRRLHVYSQRRCEMKHGLNFFSGSTAHEGPSASSRINFQASLSLAIFLQPRTPIFFRSFSTSPNHLFLGFPTDLFPSGLFLKSVVGTGRVKIRPCFYKFMKAVPQSWDSGSIPWLSVCDLWWTKWRWVCFYSKHFGFPFSIILPMSHTQWFFYCRRYTISEVDSIVRIPWSRVLDKPQVSNLVKKFPEFHATRRFTINVTSVRHFARWILSALSRPISWDTFWNYSPTRV